MQNSILGRKQQAVCGRKNTNSFSRRHILWWTVCQNAPKLWKEIIAAGSFRKSTDLAELWTVDSWFKTCALCTSGGWLTPTTLINSLIEHIEFHYSDKSGDNSYVKVDIYFTAVGMIDIPTEKEFLATMEEIRKNQQDFKFVA